MSIGLEALKLINLLLPPKYQIYPVEWEKPTDELINIIKKELDVFEIMKKNLGAPFDYLKYYETVQEWNEEYGDDYPLTNEDFDLLQRVLK